MKSKLFFKDIMLIDILTIILVILVFFIHFNPLRIVLSIPFLLFFPGYMLVEALFLKPSKLDGIERLTFSLGLSVAISGLIGFILNYTSSGVTVEPVVFSVGDFIVAVSAIALIRRANNKNREIKVPKLSSSYSLRKTGKFNNSVTAVLVILIIAAIGGLAYGIYMPKAAEKVDEFYILGYNHKAEDYPTEFSMANGQIVGVKYGTAVNDTSGSWGKVTLGIVDRNKGAATYTITINIDGQQMDSVDKIKNAAQLNHIQLSQDEKWEQEIAFSPAHLGQNQNVQFLLSKADSTAPVSSLNLWIDVVGLP